MADGLPFSPWPLDDIVAVRGKLEELAAQGRTQELIVRVRDDNTALQVRLHNLLRQLYGRRSEKVDASQLLMLFGQLGQQVPDSAVKIVDELRQDAANGDSSAAGSGSEQTVPQPDQQPRPAGGHKGRSVLPPDMPRDKQVYNVPEDQRMCITCGNPKKTIGYETSEYLEFVPAQLRVIEQQREKVACPKCDEPGIVVAANEKVMPHGRPGPRLSGGVGGAGSE